MSPKKYKKNYTSQPRDLSQVYQAGSTFDNQFM